MSCNTGNISNINKTFILEALPTTATTTTLSACTSMFTNFIQSCSGNTNITLATDLISFSNNLNVNGWISGNTFSAITVNANTIYSGGTDLLDIINTHINTFVTGATFSDNSLVLRRNDNVNISLIINNFSGLTVNGNTIITGNTNISGNTSIGGNIISGGTNLLNIFALAGSDTNTYVTGITNSNNNIIITRNDGQTLSTNISTLTGLTVNGDFLVTGNSNLSGTTSFGSNIISGGTNLSNIFKSINSLDVYTTGVTLNNNILYFDRNDVLSAYTVNLSTFSSNDVYVTGGTFNNNNLLLRNNTGGTFNILINNFSGLTVNGSLSSNIISATTISATTYYGNGSNLTGIATQDTRITGFTYNNSNLLTITNSTGGTLSTLVNTFSGATFNGNITVTGTSNLNGTIISSNLSGSTDRMVEVNSGGTLSATRQIISAYLTSGSTAANLLENTSNWDVYGNYIGTSITGTYMGQKFYNDNYFFEAIADNSFIRLIRG